MKANEPQTDREWMIKLSGQIETLSLAITSFGNKLVDIEEKKLYDHEVRLVLMENRWQQIKGGWKLGLALWAFITVSVGWLIKYLSR